MKDLSVVNRYLNIVFLLHITTNLIMFGSTFLMKIYIVPPTHIYQALKFPSSKPQMVPSDSIVRRASAVMVVIYIFHSVQALKYARGGVRGSSALA